jgi:hypothetical protein
MPSAADNRFWLVEHLLNVGYKTSFSYIDQESGIERTVGLPEQGGLGLSPKIPCCLGRYILRLPTRKQRLASSGSK